MAVLSKHPSSTRSEPDIALVDDDLYSVMDDHETLGFVHRAGSVFVALSGRDMHHAVEVGQSLSFDRAVQMVLRS